MSALSETADQTEIHRLLERWADATRHNRQDDILAHHAPDVLIYDVLAPMKYEGAAAYRASWGDWQPETQGEGEFVLEDLVVVAGVDVAFAHGFIRCGGTFPDGRSFTDLVRATFCLQRSDRAWTIVHQHISKPLQMGGGG